MPVDPTVQPLLDAIATAEGPSILESTPEQAREAMEAFGGFARREEVGAVDDRTIPGPGGRLAVRVYTPDSPAPHGALAWFHGGGFVIGSLDTHDGVCRALCNRADVVVVAVDYRLAPESPFPAAVEDAEAAFDWVREQAHDLGVDAARVAVGGDSAGGNLAAVVAQSRREVVAFQLLVYPVVDATMSFRSIDENADGYVLTRDHMTYFTGHYLGDGDPTDPRVSPLYADDLSGLPPAHLLTAEFDPLRDEGDAYAEAMSDAGVDVEHVRYDGMVHTFFQLNAVVPRADVALDAAAAALRRALAS